MSLLAKVSVESSDGTRLLQRACISKNVLKLYEIKPLKLVDQLTSSSAHAFSVAAKTERIFKLKPNSVITSNSNIAKIIKVIKVIVNDY